MWRSQQRSLFLSSDCGMSQGALSTTAFRVLSRCWSALASTTLQRTSITDFLQSGKLSPREKGLAHRQRISWSRSWGWNLSVWSCVLAPGLILWIMTHPCNLHLSGPIFPLVSLWVLISFAVGPAASIQVQSLILLDTGQMFSGESP